MCKECYYLVARAHGKMCVSATRIEEPGAHGKMNVQFTNCETDENYGILKVRVSCGVSLFVVWQLIFNL